MRGKSLLKMSMKFQERSGGRADARRRSFSSSYVDPKRALNAPRARAGANRRMIGQGVGVMALAFGESIDFILVGRVHAAQHFDERSAGRPEWLQPLCSARARVQVGGEPAEQSAAPALPSQQTLAMFLN